MLATSVAASVVSGRVLIKAPGARAFTPLSGPQLIPVGSTIDATSGRVRVTSAASGRATHSGQFYEARERRPAGLPATYLTAASRGARS